MSFDAIAWAIKQPVKTQGERLVLMAIADVADEKYRSWPSHRHIAEFALCSESTVKRVLKKLEADGFVLVSPRYKGKSRTSNLYILPPGQSDPTLGHSEPTPGSDNEPTPRSPDDLGTNQLTNQGTMGGRKRPSRKCPADWKPPENWQQWIADNAPLVENPTREMQKFRNHEFAKTYTDWNATCRNWFLKAQGWAEKDARRSGAKVTTPAAAVDPAVVARQTFSERVLDEENRLFTAVVAKGDRNVVQARAMSIAERYEHLGETPPDWILPRIKADLEAA